MTDKRERQRLVVGLLQDHQVQSQGQLLGLLAEYGVQTTQATVSRDLSELGAVKVRGNGGELVYRLSDDLTDDDGPADSRERLRRVVEEFVVDVDHSGNLAVLRTPPAGAGPVASAIDIAQLPGVLATVAGDDTVLVVARPGVDGAAVADRFRDI